MPLFGKRKTERRRNADKGIAYIPRQAELFGSGPDPVAPGYDDPHPGTQSLYGNPGAPTVGRDFPTMGQIAEDGKRADPRANPSAPRAYYDRLGRDDSAREGVAYVMPTGIAVQVPTVHRAAARPVAPPPERWTGTAHPELNSYANPSAIGLTPKELNGAHFSMADHRREYDILGMKPAQSRRNTYRAEPTAWDVDIVDRPAEGDYTPQAIYEAPPTPETALYGTRAFRL